MSSHQCFIHFKDVKGPLKPFSSISFEKARHCHELWINLDGEHRLIAEKCSGIFKDVAQKSSSVSDYFCHRSCYSRFTNVANINRSQARCAKIMANRTENTDAAFIKEQDTSTQAPNKKMLRSSMPSTSTTTSRSTAVLPPTCIICNKFELYVTDSFTRKRKLDPLMSAETIDGGKLREAATRKDDQRILIHILDKDCVAVEVKYHKCCYLRYTSFLSKPQKSDSSIEDSLYSKSFDTFCTTVKKQLIDRHNIWYMTKLKEEFVKTVKREENQDASSYKTSRLRNRLKERFPQLVFHTPNNVRSKNEFVYVEELSRESVVERLLTSNSDSETDTSDDEEEDGDESSQFQQTFNKRTVELKDLYLVALALRENIREHCTSWYENWPPLASDITGDSVRKVVSPLLYNFMSWVLGYSDEPQDSTYTDMCEEYAVKVYSVCQDVVYNASKGKTQTPKSLALAMATRQISGCSDLIRILNGLGHSVSLSSTMAYDSAIAQHVIDTSNIVPREFAVSSPINLVFDNIDFGEEVKKQTHVTNGIITQKVSHRTPIPQLQPNKVTSEPPPTIQKTQRTVDVPEQAITPFNIGTKKTPAFNLQIEEVTGNKTSASETAAKLLDLAYTLLKMVPLSPDLPVLPGWTGFNTLLQKENIPDTSRVGYLPVIDASPTEYSTINEILKRSTEITDKLKLKYATLVFDEAVYAKIQQVRWKNEEYYNRFIVRLGEFHAIMSYLSAVSKIFEDGGLKDIFIESGIVSEGSIKGVMSGKHYNRSVLCHKVMYEALQRLRISEFLDTLDEESQENVSSFVVTMKQAFDEDGQIDECINTDLMEEICQHYDDFIAESSAKSLTFAYWSMYIHMTGILLSFIRATREVNWSLHLSSFRSMIPWFFACDRVNYARYGSAYWLEMISLEKTHPGALPDVSANFAVQRQSNYGFAAVACDQTIEQTANRDSKTKGGLVGFSMNRASVHRWLLSQSERVAITGQCKQMACLNRKPRGKKDLDATKCQNYENSVCDVMTTISSMINPFDSDQEGLINVATGVELQKDSAKSLLDAEQLGESQLTAFCEDNLLSEKPDIFTKMKKNQLTTFSRKTKTMTDKKGQTIAVKSTRKFFARLLVISKTREIDLKGLLSYSLNEYPLSIATVSGDLVKTTKSKMFEILEKTTNNSIAEIERLRDGTALVVDALAVVQAMKGKWKTFGEFADSVYSFLLNLSKQLKAVRLDFVADRYPSLSIKNAERAKRASEGVQKVHIYSKEQSTPKQWKKFLSCGENKESLVVFLSSHWSTYQSSQMKSLESFYITSTDKCYLLSPGLSLTDTVESHEVVELRCDHEEADTRLILHAKHAAESHHQIIIKTPDTDVFVLAIATQKTIAQELYLMTGNGNRSRIVDIAAISDELGEELCASLPGLHAFTGCDTTSAFVGKGKMKPWKLLLEQPHFTSAFARLGKFPMDTDVEGSLNKFVCLLYGDTISQNVDECRYNLFKAGKCSDEALPPNTECLKNHIARTNYQAASWNGCLTSILLLPSPVGNGWELDGDQQLKVLWMTSPSAPESVLEFVQCRCKGGCKTQRCSCLKSGFKCTEVCSCTECRNFAPADSEESDDDDNDDDDDEDDEDDDENMFNSIE